MYSTWSPLGVYVDLCGSVKYTDSAKSLEMIGKNNKPIISCHLLSKQDTAYYVQTTTVLLDKANVATVHVADYDTWHKYLGHHL